MNKTNSGAVLRTVAQCLLCILVAGCKPAVTTSEGTTIVTSSAETKAEPITDWQWLFNGESVEAWTGTDGEAIGEQWQIIDNALVLTAAGGGAVVTKQSFTDFELELEWQIAASGNSGIFYKVAGPDSTVRSGGLEYQLLDNDNYPGHDNPVHFTAALFDIYPPQFDAHLAAGSWNNTRIVVRYPHVEHWLNDKLVLQFELGSADWQKQAAQSRFAPEHVLGANEPGHIMLQDHGDRIAFRQIRIRAL